MNASRRNFLRALTGTAAVGVLEGYGFASVREAGDVSIGLELYTVDAAMKQDFEGTLRKIAEIGYRELEFPWYYGRSASQIVAALKTHGLRCRSGLFSWEELESDLSARIDFARALGVTYMGCVMIPLPEARDIRAAIGKLRLDDFRRYADRFNEIGARVRSAGMQFTYHNHDFEFRRLDGVIGYDELLRRTDSKLVQMEMDVGWVAWAGHDPVRYLREYPGRIALLHVRDFKRDGPHKELEMHSVEVGRGVMDWNALFAAASASGVTVGFVEQDPSEPPASIESARMSLEYLQALRG